jgi:lipopolysaccharide/colanic/teichoic acid biosynthesis glycosyltransferase
VLLARQETRIRREQCERGAPVCLVPQNAPFSVPVPVSASALPLSNDAAARAIPRWKRILDIAISLTALILVGPVVTLIVAAMQCASPGPLLFRQSRLGFKRQPFDCLKFRTMRTNADTQAHEQYMHQLIRSKRPLEKLDATDPRLLPGARILRASGLDELPQIINVLRGEMSIVGPRPCLPFELDHCTGHLSRFDTHPGLTGLWQVNGKTRTTFEQMLQFDVRYAHQRTLALDLKILALTVPTLVQQVTNVRRQSPIIPPLPLSTCTTTQPRLQPIASNPR